ncbi:hypothetical protein ACFQ08_06170 [Streptosporangium algeriense]|uniref:Transcriptional regulator n=1 Tax=Streptosporangium algeriense TaxID=1682748 RepID=A0ABW3DMV4_9ACTN
MTTVPASRSQAVNLRLAALLREAGFSRKSFARTLRQTSERAGWPIACDHTSISRWLRGMTPRAETADLIALTLSQALGRPISRTDAGLIPPTAPVSGEVELQRRLAWLTAEVEQLRNQLAAVTA